VIDASPVPMCLNDEALRITLLNRAFVETFGWTEADLPDLEAWWPRAYPDPAYRAEVAARWAVELDGARREGTPFRPLEVDVRCKDGSTRVVLAGAGPLHGAYEGEHLVTLVDITQQKEAERERARLSQELLQAQKMESVGRLAGGVAHDFNNMLGAILGHVDLALEQVDPSGPLFDDLLEIRKAAQRSAELTRQLLAFARKQTAAPRVIDLDETIAGSLKMLGRMIGENVELVHVPRRGLFPVRIDPAQVDQILANLCVNARDAILDVGRVVIATENVTLDERFTATHPGARPGRHVRLSVTDDGAGMSAETLAHAFEPFFTTKPVGKGTGLGLATVYGIVKQNHGYVEVTSEVGVGTTFSVYLPEHVGPAATAGADEPSAAPRGNETVLLVEDEPAILRLTTRILTGLGYTVLGAGSPLGAIRMAADHAGPIHLLMTDVVMPEMNGRDLAAALTIRFPEIRRLFMSGYTADVIAQHSVVDDGVAFIQKPFTRAEVAAKVRAVLDAAG
jgi:PAS domain S-box-containing protein